MSNEPFMLGVWLQARGRKVKIRDGAGPDAPSKLVGHEPRWFEHVHASQYERDPEVMVVHLPRPDPGFVDIAPGEFREKKKAPPSPSEIVASLKQELARAKALNDEQARRIAALELELAEERKNAGAK
jgi:hypothetical protein